MRNRLASARSPYLLQHARNPVWWWEWCDEAFEAARRDDKPVFLSIGYSTCHWCHVMERESFEDARVADVLNKHFISIKVDREERPDVDHIYMTALQMMGENGGWPLSVWLTPGREPFFAGTYFPRESRYGRMGFVDLLLRIVKLWQEQRERLLLNAQRLTQELREISRSSFQQRADNITLEAVERAVGYFLKNFDHEHGGFGGAPKFPRPSVLELLLRHAAATGSAASAEAVYRTLDAMIAGGIHDQLGGGFARYSVDEKWLVPHFEKMLYDQAQLISALTHAHHLCGDAERRARYRDAVGSTVDYLREVMRHPRGAFFSAEDADSEGREGAFYVWTLEALREALGAEDARFAAAMFGVTEEGNFHDHSPGAVQPPGECVLSLAKNAEELAGEFSTSLEAARAKCADVRRRLKAARERRPRPHLDDKVNCAWNALLIGALARAGRLLGETGYVNLAAGSAEFIRSEMWEESTGRLAHIWRDGVSEAPPLLDDYAFLADALVDLTAATLDDRWLEWAEKLCGVLMEKFADREGGGFYQSAPETGDLICRMKEDYDGAEPAGNSAAIHALQRVGFLKGRQDFSDFAIFSLKASFPKTLKIPDAYPWLLCALLREFVPRCVVKISGPSESAEVQALLAACSEKFLPWIDLTRGSREAVCAELCLSDRCLAPLDDPRALRSLMDKELTRPLLDRTTTADV